MPSTTKLTNRQIFSAFLSVFNCSNYFFTKWSLRILMTKMIAAQVAVMKLVMKKKMPFSMPDSIHSIKP